jgi:hypothetical protein
MRILETLRQDVRERRNLDTYVATLIALVFAALSIVGDIVPESLKWSAVFAALGMLLFRITLPARPATPVERLIGNRDAFVETPFPELIRNATQLWVFGPSAINLLSQGNCESIRRALFDKGTSDVRIVLLDPGEAGAVALAVRHLDESLDFPGQDFESALAASVHQLERMTAWDNAGHFDYRFVGYNPGFSLVAVDPTSRDGRVIVEFHGFRNETTGSRMHLTLTRRDSDEWFQYWTRQFEEIWTSSRTPEGSPTFASGPPRTQQHEAAAGPLSTGSGDRSFEPSD